MSSAVSCVIPALDAAGTLATVAHGLRGVLPKALLIAVDDGSRDATREVARETCDVVLGFDRNRGKGAALRAGLECALERGAGAVLTIDADGQHDPGHAPALLDALERADVAVGARRRAGSSMPFHRRLTNTLSSAAFGAITGVPLADSQSGFRAFRRAVVERVTGRGERYEFETDMLIRVVRAGFRVVTVPVPTLYGAPSHFRLWSDTVLLVRTLWSHHAGSPR
jgi:glycosyltransferase involved in cell wall biosynthesis